MHPLLTTFFVQSLIFKGPVYGAYSELYAAFSPDIPASHNGGHLMAWGRVADSPEDMIKGMKSEKEGGSGRAKIFLDYCDREIKDFL
jgi:retinol dehydrogenase 12